MDEFTNEQEHNSKRTYSERQQKVLDTVWDFGGDAVAAARAAGFSNPYSAVDTLRDELVEMAEKAMARLSLKSVHTMEKVLDANAEFPVSQASEKLKAAQLILDRTNPKVEKIDVTTDTGKSIFVLPEKRPLDEPQEV